MAYKSKAQQRAMHAKEARGEIPASVVEEFDAATKAKKGGFASLPEKLKKADGGIVPGFRVVKEHPRHFEAHGRSGPFKIAKSGLSPGRLATFQAMCAGGVVQRKAEGGEVEEEGPKVYPTAQRAGLYSGLPVGAPTPSADPRYGGAAPPAAGWPVVQPEAERLAREFAASYSPAAGGLGAAGVAALRSALPGGGPFKEELRRYNEAAQPHPLDPSDRSVVPGVNALVGRKDLSDPERAKAVAMMVAQTAYHGTPHAWEGSGQPLSAAKGKTFDFSKMSTGEGNQAYGWGGYATKVPEIGERYRATLTKGPRIEVAGQDVTPGTGPEHLFAANKTPQDNVLGRVRAAAMARDQLGVPYDQASLLSEIRGNLMGSIEANRNAGDMRLVESLGAQLKALDDMAPQTQLRSRGRLYRLDAPEDHELLHFDKPMSEQPPGVQEKVIALMRQQAKGNHDPEPFIRDVLPDLHGDKVYRMAGFGDDRKASEALRGAGIPGHLYTGHESGAENMVIYDPARAPVTEAAASLAEARKVNPQFNRGGKVPEGRGFDLSRVKLVKETPTAWMLHDGRAPFRVAKAGLGKGVHDRIVQHFQEGGGVKEEPQASTDPSLAMPIDPSLQVAAAPVASMPPPPEPGGAGPSPGAPIVRERDPFDVAVGGLKRGARATWEALTGKEPEPLPKHETLLPEDQTPTAPGPGDTPMAPPPPDFLQRPPLDTSPGPGDQSLNLPGMPADIARDQATATQMMLSAARAKEVADNGMAAERYMAQVQAAQEKQKLANDWDVKIAQSAKDSQEVQRKIENFEIDPNRYWKNRGTPGQISSVIGLILGGIGAGLTRSPSAALQVLENAIDRDVEAQKANLGKEQSRLAYYMQQGHTLQNSKLLALAEHKESVATQMTMIADKYAGASNSAGFQMVRAQLLQSAAQNRQQAHMLGLSSDLQAMQLARAKQDYAYARTQMGVLQQLTNPGAQPGGQAAMGARPRGTMLDPRAISVLPDHIQKTLVRLPDGSFTTARDDVTARKVQESFDAADVLREKLGRYGAILSKHPHGVSSTTDPADYEAADALFHSILTDINGLANMNRFTHEEGQLYARRVPEITSKQFRDVGHQAKLRELGSEVDDKVWSSSKNFLNLPIQPRTVR